MAIGDTVQAGLMRVDSSPILLAGQAQAKANQAFGDALGGAVEKFYQKKKDKHEREQRERAYREAGLSAEEAKAASGDKELGSLLINKMNADRNFFLAQQEGLIEKEKEKRAADQFDLESDKRQKQKDFSQFLISTTTDPNLQTQVDQAKAGSFAFPGSQLMRNRFIDSMSQVPVGGLSSSNFAKAADEAGVDPVLAAKYFLGLRDKEADAAKSTGKTMNVFDPKSGQNVIAQVNPDGSPGRIVGIAPTQPPRIPDPKDVREANINKTEDNQAMATEADWKARALTGRNTIQTVKTMLSTLDKVDDTGGFEPFKNTLRKYAMSAGVDFTDDEKEKLANAEKFNQLSGEFVFKAISQTKGSISEKEMDLFQAMSPSMVNSKLGNRLMLEYAQKRANRDVELNKYIQGLKKQGMLPQERVEMAMAWLNDPANDITQDLYEHFGTSANSSTPPPQAQPNRQGVRGGNPPPNSNASTKNGFQILKR
jgi:hypothetical protein